MIKKRYWACVIYPESVRPDYKEFLEQKGIETVISPLHDKDKNATGEDKKPHYHMIFAYPNTTTYNNVFQLTTSIGATIPIGLESLKGYYRYLTHKDNPEKYQYDEKDIVTLNGFCIDNYAELTQSEIGVEIKKICKIIKTYVIVEYFDLLNILEIDEDKNLFHIARNNTIFFNTYISSLRNKLKNTNNSENTGLQRH